MPTWAGDWTISMMKSNRLDDSDSAAERAYCFFFISSFIFAMLLIGFLDGTRIMFSTRELLSGPNSSIVAIDFYSTVGALKTSSSCSVCFC